MTHHPNPPPIHPITEDDIANYLVHTPEFFERNADALTAIRLSSGHGNRAVSLQERQAELLREKIKVLELRLMDMIRNGNDNTRTDGKLHRWACGLLHLTDTTALAQQIASSIEREFAVAQVAIKVWGVAESHRDQPFAQGASEDSRSFASSLASPYCGANAGFEAAQWLAHPADVASMALIPLRAAPPQTGSAPASPSAAFGLLVLASPDPERFHADMGTAFLERMGELTSAALSRLR